MSAEAADLARAAARELAARGLHKGEFEDSGGSGRVCMWGAIQCVQNEQGYRALVEVDLRLALADRFADEPWYGVYLWPGADFNDADDTTCEDVQKVLLQVADDLDVTP